MRKGGLEFWVLAERAYLIRELTLGPVTAKGASRLLHSTMKPWGQGLNLVCLSALAQLGVRGSAQKCLLSKEDEKKGRKEREREGNP